MQGLTAFEERNESGQGQWCEGWGTPPSTAPGTWHWGEGPNSAVQLSKDEYEGVPGSLYNESFPSFQDEEHL